MVEQTIKGKNITLFQKQNKKALKFQELINTLKGKKKKKKSCINVFKCHELMVLRTTV